MLWTHISAAGLDLLRKMDPVTRQLPKDLLGHLNPAELSELIRLLERAREPGCGTARSRELSRPAVLFVALRRGLISVRITNDECASSERAVQSGGPEQEHLCHLKLEEERPSVLEGMDA